MLMLPPLLRVGSPSAPEPGCATSNLPRALRERDRNALRSPPQRPYISRPSHACRPAAPIRIARSHMFRASRIRPERASKNWTAAKKRALSALELAKGRDVEYTAAFALARSGEISVSQRRAADLEKRFPEDTPVQFEYLPTLHALFALAHQAPLDAVERLQRAVPYEFALPGTGFFGKFGGLYPAYIRGEAYLAAGRGHEAAAEFQKVLSHRGIVLADPIGALAHLQLGRAYALSGDNSKASVAYQQFLDLWDHADEDVPVLKQARAEYARLPHRGAR
jgi:hypothetical protein